MITGCMAGPTTGPVVSITGGLDQRRVPLSTRICLPSRFDWSHCTQHAPCESLIHSSDSRWPRRRGWTCPGGESYLAEKSMQQRRCSRLLQPIIDLATTKPTVTLSRKHGTDHVRAAIRRVCTRTVSSRYGQACALICDLRTHTQGWRFGVVVGALVSINEVNLRRARLVLRWVTVSEVQSAVRENLSQYIKSHPGQLSLAIPPWVGVMSTNQRTVMPCGWGVKTCMVREWVAGITVWSPCYHGPYLSALSMGSSHNRALYKCPITLLTLLYTVRRFSRVKTHFHKDDTCTSGESANGNFVRKILTACDTLYAEAIYCGLTKSLFFKNNSSKPEPIATKFYRKRPTLLHITFTNSNDFRFAR